jgi:MFS family permease
MDNTAELEQAQPDQATTYYANRRLFYWNVFWVILGNSATVFGVQTIQSLMPLHMARINLDARQISLVMAATSWLLMPLSLYIAHLTDNWQWKWGRRLPFVAFSTPFIVLAMIWFPYTTGMLGCFMVYCLYYSMGTVRSSTIGYLGVDVSRQKYWGRISAATSVFGSVAVWLGQFYLMPLATGHGEKLVFFIGAAFVAVTAVATLLFVREPPIRSQRSPEFNPVPVIWNTLKFGFSTKRRILICIMFAMISSIGLSATYVPLQAKVNLGLSEGEIGRYILQWATLLSVGLTFFAGMIIDKFGPLKCALVGYVFAFISVMLGCNPIWSSHLLGLAGLHASPTMVLATAYVSIGIVGTFAYTAAIVFVMASVDRTEIATFCACTGSFNLFLTALNMVLIGWIISAFFNNNYGIVFIIMMILFTLGMLFFIFLSRKPSVPASGTLPAGGERAEASIK